MPMHTLPSLLLLLAGSILPTHVARSESAEKPGRHLFILSGQSNMTPTLSGSFQNCVQQVFGKDKVLVTMTGHPGQPIKQWVKEWTPPAGMTDPKAELNGSLYTRMIENVRRSLKNERPSTVTFIWMQGEADAESGWASVYEKSFQSLLNQLKTDLDIQEIHHVVGRINEYWLEKKDGQAMREVLVKLGKRDDHSAWINTDDLNQGVNPWGGFSYNDGHYPPSGYVVMGQRFAKEACRLIDPEFKPDPAIFGEKFIDSSDDIHSHAAIGKPVTGTAPDAGHDGGGKGLALLTDGKFGGANGNDPAWLGFAPAGKPIELVIDLGEPVNIDAIAVNMLLSSKVKAEFPNKITYSTSEDGETFKTSNSRNSAIYFYNKRELADLRARGIEPRTALLLRGQAAPNTRKVRIEIETGDQCVILDEITVNPGK
jgi:hypothetical protein